MRASNTVRAISESVAAARAGQAVRIITSRTAAKQLRALLSGYADGVRTDDKWVFGSGSVEIVT